MPDLPSPEMMSVIKALDAAFEKPPQDLPDGTMEMAKELGQRLRGYTGDESALSPGEKEAKLKQAPGSDEAVPYPHAAKGVDGPSPGQQEFSQVQQQARELADSLGSLGR